MHVLQLSSLPYWFFYHLPHHSPTPFSSHFPLFPPFYFPQIHCPHLTLTFPYHVSLFFSTLSSLLSSPGSSLFIHTVWYIGSETQATDILPRTEVSFNSSHSATVDSGVLYLDGAAFANISEIIALGDGKEEDPADSLFYFEPGRLLYHSVEFCNFVHRCVVTETNTSIVIRKEMQLCYVRSFTTLP